MHNSDEGERSTDDIQLWYVYSTALKPAALEDIAPPFSSIEA